jgi:DNA-binding NarL/FixJ family response regulator
MLFSDISMPILNGIGAANKLKDSGCRSKIVFLTVHADSDYVLRCLVTGTHGCVAKCHMATDLLPAINEALAGRNFIFSKLPPLGTTHDHHSEPRHVSFAKHKRLHLK